MAQSFDRSAEDLGNIVDPDDGRQLFTIEHEVRSMTHPMYARPLVNRNPAQTTMNYQAGHDQWFG